MNSYSLRYWIKICHWAPNAHPPNVEPAVAAITPYPPGRVFVGVILGSKLPGYYHSVPSGQKPLTTYPHFRLHIRRLQVQPPPLS
jgi:hypothetical protein